MLRSRESRREAPLEAHGPEPIGSGAEGIDPEREAMLVDSVGLAMLVVLIVGRSPTAARAARESRAPPGAGSTVSDADPIRQREVVDAFLAASRGGDFAALLALLDPDVVLRADGAAVLAGASREVRGADPVASTFSWRARFAQPALVNGAAEAA